MRFHLAVLASGLFLLTCLAGAASADDSTIYRGRPLLEVLHELQEAGLELVYSSAVVSEDLLVTVEPASRNPRSILDEILEPLGLEAKDGPAGSIQILPRSRGDLRGGVYSSGRATPIEGASIQIDGTESRATSRADGSFEIRELPIGTYRIAVDAPGYRAATISRVRITQRDDAELAVQLHAQPTFVTEVVVVPGRHSVVQQEQAARRTISNQDAVLVPTIGGDISRVVEQLPGVSAPDNSAAFHVRGSETEDVSLILDGLELYDPFHLHSFQAPFSLVDSTVVDRIDLFGGGFTADFGDRHGGFVEISTLLPDESDRGEIELGTLHSRFSYRAPMKKTRGSWMVSFRAWYPEEFEDTIELGGGERNQPEFGDAYVKASFVVSPRTLFSVHGLLAYDRLKFSENPDEEDPESANTLTRSAYVWLRARNAWSENLSSETVLSGGRLERPRDGISAPQDESFIVDDDRVVDFFGLKHDSTWRIGEAHALKAGAYVHSLSSEYRYFRQSLDEPTNLLSVDVNPDGTSLGLYLAHRARVTSKIATEVGLRWDRQTYTDDRQLSPRFNAVWQPTERTEVRLGVGRFFQSQRIHELNVEDGETDFFSAEESEQVELTVQHSLRDGPSLRIDAYYRELSDLRPRYENLFEPLEFFPETGYDRVRLEPSEATLQGIELMLRGDAHRPFSWWVSYALSKAEDVIDGNEEPRAWDQRHAAKGLIGYRWGRTWSVSLGGTAHTGWPTTPVFCSVPGDEEEPCLEAEMGDRNSDRFATYVRFDLKARRSFVLPRGRLWLSLDVVNLADRKNACCIDEFEFEFPEEGNPETVRELDYWLGRTPSFSILWEF
jgi:outer membrane receptor protein involved in Fe transport